MNQQELAVLQASSLRELVDKVNQVNSANAVGPRILKENIVDIMDLDGTFFLLYFK